MPMSKAAPSRCSDQSPDAKSLEPMDLLHIVIERNLALVERILRGLSGGEDTPEPVSRTGLAARFAAGYALNVIPADEYAAGHIPGALNATLAQLEELLPSLAPDVEIVA
ncbi:rhodanese-like domain-containing protein [Salipiger aestuarii]|nr:hypothetical protein [Salipiger aestuarii]